MGKTACPLLLHPQRVRKEASPNLGPCGKLLKVIKDCNWTLHPKSKLMELMKLRPYPHRMS
eukprot:7711905-Karenia_brevis.AAC.1